MANLERILIVGEASPGSPWPRLQDSIRPNTYVDDMRGKIVIYNCGYWQIGRREAKEVLVLTG